MADPLHGGSLLTWGYVLTCAFIAGGSAKLKARFVELKI